MRNTLDTSFNVLFPDECRICEGALTGVSRIPVCRICLALPQPLESEYFCQGCKTSFADPFLLDDQDLCTVCRQGLVNFDAAYSFGNYEGVLRKLIHLFKYAKVESLAKPLSRMLVRALPLESRFDMVMAMPMHWWKQWQRGFNQAELLAEPVARRFGLKLAGNLRRRRYTKSQAGLTETERQNNLKNSFFVHHGKQIAGKRILLVDDVYTTGATLRSAAKALKEAAAGHVAALTLARVDRRLWHEEPPNSPTKSRHRSLAAGTGVS